MLALAPHLVRQERIASGGGITTPVSIEERILDLSVTWPWSSDDAWVATEGVTGEPTGARAEFGEQLIEAAVAAAARIVEQLLDEAAG
jgi:creatinine amidohydrolase/Fe(II)-dependent formamide hydrolase-like protein